MKKTCLLLALLLPCIAVRAEPPSPAKLALAREVVTAIRADKMFEGMSAQFKQLAMQMAPPLPNATPEQRQIMDRFMAQVMDLSLASAKGLIAKMDETYAAVFSEQELSAMKAFYQSPEGQSVIAKQPQIISTLMPMVQQSQRELQPKLHQLAEQLKADLEKAKPAEAKPAQ